MAQCWRKQDRFLNFTGISFCCIQVSSIRASKSDDKRLYIFSGTKTLHLRCETEEDRNAWIDALLAAKDQFPRSLTSNDLGPMADIMLSSEKLRARLLQEGLSEAVIRECESIMMSELLELHKQIKSQQQQHSILIDRLRQLEVIFLSLVWLLNNIRFYFLLLLLPFLVLIIRNKNTSSRENISILFSEGKISLSAKHKNSNNDLALSLI